MSKYQKCPVCEGHAWLRYPPGTPNGGCWSGASLGPWPCHRCDGTGTIERPNLREIQLHPFGLDSESQENTKL